MRPPRRRRGFEAAGSVPATQLGFSRRRARELALIQAWERAAGKTLSRHAKVLRVERGVLLVEAADRSWYEGAEPLLPQLAARMAVEHPELGIKKFQIRLAGSDETPEVHLVPAWCTRDGGDAEGDDRCETGPHGAGESAPRRVAAPSSTEGEQEIKRRLERVALRYVERKRSQKA